MKKRPDVKLELKPPPGTKKRAGKGGRLREWTLNGLLMAASAAVTLAAVFAAGEIWIRLNELPEDTGSVYIIRGDGLPRHVLRPGAEEIATGAPVKINQLGFRGGEYTEKKPEGAWRMIVLGDSFAFGAGAPVEAIFPTLLEERLNHDRGRAVEVLNLGVSDYNTEDQLALLREKGLALEPDLVMLFYVMNDIEIKPEYKTPEGREGEEAGDAKPTPAASGGDRVFRDPLYGVVHALRKHSLFLAYLAPRIASLGRALGFNVSSSSEFYRTAFADNVEGWRRSKEALLAIRDLGRERGFDFALVLFPLMTNFSDSYPAMESHRVIAEFAGEHEIPFLDLLPAYMGRDARSLWVSPTDGHPNAEGHRIAADAVMRFIEQHPRWLAPAGQ